MGDKFKIKLNPYFHLGLLAWVITGAVLMMTFDQRQLFSFFNSHYTTFGNYLMYGITYMGQPEVIIPVLLGLMLLIKEYRNRWFFITAIACNITPLLVQQTMKHFLYHPRPLKYYSHADWIHFEKGLWPELTGNNSFPSGHSQGAFSFFCFLSLLLPPRYRAWGFIFFCLALQVCYSRMYLAAHFFADVFTGSVIGTVTTTLMFSILYPLKGRLKGDLL